MAELTDIEAVFEHWKTQLNHPRARLDDKRKKLIGRALDNGYSVDDLRTVVDGCRLSQFHMGDNDRGKKYDSIGLLFRDSDHIDQFMGYVEQPQPPGNPRDRANRRRLGDWASSRRH